MKLLKLAAMAGAFLFLTAAASDPYATPADPAWPVVKFGSVTGAGFPLKITDSGGTALVVGTQFATWTALDNALLKIALPTIDTGVIADLPAGELGGAIANTNMCGNIEWRGQTDAAGYPLTGVQFTNFGCASRVDRQWTFKNMRFGPTDAALAADPNVTVTCGGSCGLITFHTAGGRLNLINLRVRNSSANGISSETAKEWSTRRNASIWVYDSDVFHNAKQSDQHNIYVHALQTFAFIRSISRDTNGSHELKADGDKVIVLDSVLAHATYPGSPGLKSGSAVINITRSQQSRVARSLIVQNTTGGGSAFQYVARSNSNGGFSTRTPPVFDVANDTGNVRNGRWTSAPDGPYSLVNITAQIAVSAKAGDTEIQVRAVQPLGCCGIGASGKLTLSPTQPYTVRVYLDTNSIMEMATGSPTISAIGTATFPIRNYTVNGAPCTACTAMPSAARINNPIAIKKTGDAWDTPILNPAFWNKTSPNYWWAKFVIPGQPKTLDLTKQQLFDQGYAEDNLIVMAAPVNSSVFWVNKTWQDIYWGGFATTHDIPVPPLNNPTGPTVAWPDIAGAGSWAALLAGPGYPPNGREPSGFVSGAKPGFSDMVWAWPIFVADNGMWNLPAAQGGAKYSQFTLNPRGPEFPTPPDFNVDARWLKAGVLTRVALANQSPIPPAGQTTVAVAAPAGAKSLSVVDGSGCNIGQQIMVALPLKPGAQQAIAISTVGPSPSAVPPANVVWIADALPRAAAVGAQVACFAKAGARPATWISPAQYATQ